MEIGYFAKKDIRVFTFIVILILLILAALYFVELKLHFIDNLAEKLYNILIG